MCYWYDDDEVDDLVDHHLHDDEVDEKLFIVHNFQCQYDLIQYMYENDDMNDDHLVENEKILSLEF